MNSEIIVSVIIPTFNRLIFLKESIQSVLDQTFKKFELIVVDDGSTDGTAEYLHDTDFTTVIQKNQGVSAARNTGIKVAQGKYITFLDSDDLWQEDKLEQQIEFMDANPSTMVCYTDEIWIRKGVRVNPKKIHAKHTGWIFEKCLPLCIVSPSSVLMRKEFFEKVGLFDEALPACEDYDLWLRAALEFEFHFFPEKLIIKRGGHDGQLSSQWGLDVYRVRALQKLLNSPHMNYQRKTMVLKKIKDKCIILEQGFRKRGKTADADYYKRMLDSCELKIIEEK